MFIRRLDWRGEGLLVCWSASPIQIGLTAESGTDRFEFQFVLFSGLEVSWTLIETDFFEDYENTDG